MSISTIFWKSLGGTSRFDQIDVATWSLVAVGAIQKFHGVTFLWSLCAHFDQNGGIPKNKPGSIPSTRVQSDVIQSVGTPKRTCVGVVSIHFLLTSWIIPRRCQQRDISCHLKGWSRFGEWVLASLVFLHQGPDYMIWYDTPSVSVVLLLQFHWSRAEISQHPTRSPSRAAQSTTDRSESQEPAGKAALSLSPSSFGAAFEIEWASITSYVCVPFSKLVFHSSSQRFLSVRIASDTVTTHPDGITGRMLYEMTGTTWRTPADKHHIWLRIIPIVGCTLHF